MNKAIRRITRDCNDALLNKNSNPKVLLPRFSCHSLRHTFTTRLVESGVNIKVVQDVKEAVGHIAQYSTKHSEAIITENIQTADYFLSHVDSACVYHNASTRFSDGGEFGFGAELGISTQKLHARGPLGLQEMTSYQYKIYGNGQVRE